jgi:drug/metabolite transporter (DMT)-like permease
MKPPEAGNRLYIGIALAVLATLIWSGNFVVARSVIKEISPVSLAFFRWLTACIIMLPLAYKGFVRQWPVVRSHGRYFFWIGLTGVTLFNTFVYVAGHYSPAINLALIGTTSAPIFAIILAAIFLKEKISFLRVLGLLICISGILLLLSNGSLSRLINFRFSIGDWWILAGAMCFAIYNTMVKRKPKDLSPVNFLFVAFLAGTILLFPFFIADTFLSDRIVWDVDLVLIILYLGAGTSVAAFLCWNAAIARLGAARTALFGNLIPVFSAIEAVILLGEQITTIHIVSGLLVISGLIIANLVSAKRKQQHSSMSSIKSV